MPGRGVGLGVGFSRRMVRKTARINLILRSAEQDNASVWSVSAGTVTANTLANPLDGAVTAETLTDDTSASSRGTVQTVPISGNLVQTFSVYAKAGTKSWLRMMLAAGSDTVLAWFDLGSGALGSTSAEGSGSAPSSAIVAAGNGWYRCSLTGVPSASVGVSVGAFIRMATADGQFSYQGDGSGTLHVWGAQLELGATATSYIATAGATP